MDRIFASEQIVVQAELPQLIKAYSKEVIRYQPDDIIAFSRDYFAALANGTVTSFLGGLEKRKLQSMSTSVEEKHNNAKQNTEYNGINETIPSDDDNMDNEQQEAYENYVAVSNDKRLVEFITSDMFIEYSSSVFHDACPSGSMNSNELSNAIETLSEKLEIEEVPTSDEISSFLLMFDSDHNGTLDADEFLRFTQQLLLYVMSLQYVKKDPEVQAVLSDIFNSCDEEGGGPDGILVFSEVLNAVNMINVQLPKALRVRCDHDAVNSYISQFGNEKDGLSFDEFSDMMYSLLGL